TGGAASDDQAIPLTLAKRLRRLAARALRTRHVRSLCPLSHSESADRGEAIGTNPASKVDTRLYAFIVTPPRNRHLSSAGWGGRHVSRRPLPIGDGFGRSKDRPKGRPEDESRPQERAAGSEEKRCPGFDGSRTRLLHREERGTLRRV